MGFLVLTVIWQEGNLGTEQTPQVSQSSSHQKGAPRRERPHFTSAQVICMHMYAVTWQLPFRGKKKKNQAESK